MNKHGSNDKKLSLLPCSYSLAAGVSFKLKSTQFLSKKKSAPCRPGREPRYMLTFQLCAPFIMLYSIEHLLLQEFQGSQLLLVGHQTLLPGIFHLYAFDFFQFFLQIIQEQGINDFMDVLDTGVMHPAFPPGIRVQSAFEHGPEDGGADLGPVELLAALFNQQFSSRRSEFHEERRGSLYFN